MVDLRDQRVDNWLLMSSVWPTTFICIAYVYLVKVAGPKFIAVKGSLSEILVLHKVVRYSCLWWWKVIQSSQMKQQLFNVITTTLASVNLVINVNISIFTLFAWKIFVEIRNAQTDIQKHVDLVIIASSIHEMHVFIDIINSKILKVWKPKIS